MGQQSCDLPVPLLRQSEPPRDYTVSNRLLVFLSPNPCLHLAE
jgi:hypothetical protein